MGEEETRNKKSCRKLTNLCLLRWNSGNQSKQSITQWEVEECYCLN